MKYYMNTETGEIFDTYREAKQDFINEYDGEDPTNPISFWDLYEVHERSVTYAIQGYEQEVLRCQTPEDFMRDWFEKSGYDHLVRKLIFCQSQDNEWGYKTTVWVWRYSTLYTETFIFEERDY